MIDSGSSKHHRTSSAAVAERVLALTCLRSRPTDGGSS